jgi:hypothetical protein
MFNPQYAKPIIITIKTTRKIVVLYTLIFKFSDESKSFRNEW